MTRSPILRRSAKIGTFDFGIAVGPQTGAKTLKDLVAWAKAHPLDANFAIPAAGTLPHFLGIMLGRAAGIDLRPVPYRGSAAGLTDLIAGHIPIEITTTSDLVQMAKDGRIRVLATSGRERSPFLPDVPDACAKPVLISPPPDGTACLHRRRRRPI